jgi:hypothetical protein
VIFWVVTPFRFVISQKATISAWTWHSVKEFVCNLCEFGFKERTYLLLPIVSHFLKFWGTQPLLHSSRTQGESSGLWNKGSLLRCSPGYQPTLGIPVQKKAILKWNISTFATHVTFLLADMVRQISGHHGFTLLWIHCFLSTWFRPALGPTQPPIQWVPGALSRGQSGRGVKLITHLQIVPRSRKCGSIHPLPHTPSWSSV